MADSSGAGPAVAMSESGPTSPDTKLNSPRLSNDALDVLSFGESGGGPAARRSSTGINTLMSTASQSPFGSADENGVQVQVTVTPSNTFDSPSVEEVSVHHSDITHSTHSAHLDLTKWGQWVTAVAVVGFDLELGQSLEKLYPSGIVLNRDDIKNICFMSFPDSNTGCIGDTAFHFRVRASTAHLPRYTSTHKKRYLCGSVYFRQVPDASLRRGFYQKSVVVLSEQPHPTLYARICKVIAKDYFSGSGGMAIQAACMDISHWNPPTLGSSHRLQMLGRELLVQVPGEASSIQCGVDSATGGLPPHGVMLASPFDPLMFDALQPVLTHIQLLWELMLTSEPVVVSGPTPTLCSRTVLALTSLTAPLLYRGDYRPYFTIQDTDCQTYVRQTDRFPCAILGVTNPYFDKALEKWPTKVWLGMDARSASPRPDGTRRTTSHPTRAKSGGQLDGRKQIVAKHGEIKSSFKQLLEHDRPFVKKLLSAKTSEDTSRLIRQHFWSLTQQFLIPLESFAARLMPLKRSINPFLKVPNLGQFKPEEFIGWVKKGLPPALKSRKGNWLRLYSRFLNSPNFRGWLAQKQKAANGELMRQYLCRVAESDLMKWASKRTEIEVLDLYLQIMDVCEDAKAARVMSPRILGQLREQLGGLRAALPADVLDSIAMSPTRDNRYSKAVTVATV
eukprot:m.107295 g.107295  ORF g.107295 m.107295 type:complete len:675 (+) comp21139_c2_seq6:63-2087(+)